jgi:hypothetical protein
MPTVFTLIDRFSDDREYENLPAKPDWEKATSDDDRPLASGFVWSKTDKGYLVTRFDMDKFVGGETKRNVPRLRPL